MKTNTPPKLHFSMKQYQTDNFFMSLVLARGRTSKGYVTNHCSHPTLLCSLQMVHDVLNHRTEFENRLWPF